MENVFAHKPVTNGHKVTLVGTGFRGCGTLMDQVATAMETPKFGSGGNIGRNAESMKQKFLPINR